MILLVDNYDHLPTIWRSISENLMRSRCFEMMIRFVPVAQEANALVFLQVQVGQRDAGKMEETIRDSRGSNQLGICLGHQDCRSLKGAWDWPTGHAWQTKPDPLEAPSAVCGVKESQSALPFADSLR